MPSATETMVFLTGLTGLVGSAAVTALARPETGYRFVCLVRGGNGKSAEERARAAVADECRFEGRPEAAETVMRRLTVVDGDVTAIDPEKLAADPRLADVSVILHCAADVNLGKDPSGNVFRVNYDGTKNVVDLARRLRVREFHYVATAYVAGKLTGTAYENAPTTANGFNNPYEESKCRAELLVRAAGIPFTVYRPAIIVGRRADGRIRKPLAFYRILEFLLKLKGHQASRTKQDPAGWIDLNIHCSTVPSKHVYFVPIDYVQAAIATLFPRLAEGATYHLTGAHPVSTEQIWEAVCRVMRIDGIDVGAGDKLETAEERMFSRFIGDLFPYFSSDIVFDQTNIRRAWPAAAEWDYGPDDLEKMVRSYFADYHPSVDWAQKFINITPDRNPRHAGKNL